jgi:hypothetical protein
MSASVGLGPGWRALDGETLSAVAEVTGVALLACQVLGDSTGGIQAVLFVSSWSAPPDWMDQMPIVWHHLGNLGPAILRPWPDLTHDPDRECYGCRWLAPAPGDPQAALAVDLSCTDPELAQALIPIAVGFAEGLDWRSILDEWSAE